MWKALLLTIALCALNNPAFAGSAVVTDGRFTNVYVYPNSDTETWEQHMARVRPGDAAQFSRSAIDGFSDSIMSGSWPSYFDPLLQYSGIHPPRFFGSAVANKSCVDAALRDLHNGVLQWDTIRSLANCHDPGMDPSPQLNLIFSPDIRIADIPSGGVGTGQEMCTNATKIRGWHAWGLNTPNFAALPTHPGCMPSFTTFTQVMSHEIVEMVSDPAGMGMGDFGLHELADNCENPGEVSTINGFSVERYWSNFDNNCQPRLDPPPGAQAVTWVLGQGSPLIRFTGDVHELRLTVPDDHISTDEKAEQLILVIQTGGDDLRGGSNPGDNADVTLQFAGGSVITSNVNQGRSWGNGETHTVLLNLPAGPLRVSDITGIIIRTGFGGGLSGDNWNVDKVALVVSFPNGSRLKGLPLTTVHTWLDASGAPLVRFTGDVHDHSEPVLAQDVGARIEAVNLIISTGNDDLRGGSSLGDNCDVILELNSGNSITLTNVNHGQTWGGWTINTIPVPQPIRGGDIKALRLHTNFGGGISGDNWNVNRIQLQATLSSLPFVQSVSPAVGPVSGGTKVILSGWNFTGATEVDFGFSTAVFTVDSPTQITALSPSVLGAGWGFFSSHSLVVHVGVTAPQGGSALSDADHFAYVPIVTSVSPTEGPMTGHTTVTITGQGFKSIASSTGPSRVSFGGVPAQNVYCDSSTSCVVGSPPSSPRDVDVSVDGSLPTPADHFAYLGPTVTGISPNIGPETGGANVAIRGVSLADGLGDVPGNVRFGQTVASDVFCLSDFTTSECYATSPPGTGIVDVIVTANGVESTPNPADRFIYAPFPAIGRLSPATGPASGGTEVTVEGINFSTVPGATKFTFGSAPATNVLCTSSHTCRVTSPPYNFLVDMDNVVTVTASVGNFTSIGTVGSAFTYPPAPEAQPPPCDPPKCIPRPPRPDCTGTSCR